MVVCKSLHGFEKDKQQESSLQWIHLLLHHNNNNKTTKKSPWKFFNGDLNQFYNNLEKDIKRDANNIDNYAVHRWMGDKHSTYEHYYLDEKCRPTISSISHPHPNACLMEDVDWEQDSCGLNENNPNGPCWDIPFPKHNMNGLPPKFLRTSFMWNSRVMMSWIHKSTLSTVLKHCLHSPNLTHTLQVWSHHLDEGGILCVIDDFLAIGTSFEDEEVQEFVKSWQAPSLVTPTQMVSDCQTIWIGGTRSTRFKCRISN